VDPEGAEPVYLELADTLELYAAIVGGTAAQAADQLRDPAGLESALDRADEEAGPGERPPQHRPIAGLHVRAVRLAAGHRGHGTAS
jgi:hypothetical protein